MYFKYGNFINYKFNNQNQQLPDTISKNHTREDHTISFPPLYLSYIPNIDLINDPKIPDVYTSIKGKKDIYDPRISVYQSIQQYKRIT
jgi:hypothetical protein